MLIKLCRLPIRNLVILGDNAARPTNLQMQQAAQAEKRLQQLSERLGVTRAGFKWMDVALDPFKDITCKPEGYPDRVMTPSVVQTIHETLDVAGPGGGVNWDCNIFVDQIYKKVALFNTAGFIPSVLAADQQSGSGVARGGVVVRVAPAGLILNSDVTTTGIPFPNDPYTSGESRVIAIGLEVHNTTAELNKQGSVIVYRVNDAPNDIVTTTVLTDAATTACTSSSQKSIELVDPPEHATIALDLPGSLQWEAKDGVYVVPVFIEEDNMPGDFDVGGVVSLDADEGTLFSAISTRGTLAYVADSQRTARIPTSLSGAYFTGLSPETTLTVNLILYVETFPYLDNSLKRVASPSCPEDYVAIKTYTQLARYLPTGVPVNDNFVGAFIAGLSRLAQLVVPQIPRLLGGLSSLTTGVESAVGLGKTVMDYVGKRNQPKIEDKTEIIAVKQLSNKQNNKIIQTSNNTNNNSRLVIMEEKPSKQKKEIVVIEQQQQRKRRGIRPAIVSAMPIRGRRSQVEGSNRFMRAIQQREAGNRWLMPQTTKHLQ